MPHLSQKGLSSEKLKELNKRLFTAFANTNTHTRKQLYEELLTNTERIMIAKRLEMLLLLQKGISSYKISKTLEVSPSTVARFEHAITNGRFRQTAKWLGQQKFSNQILQLLSELAMIPFEVAKKKRTLRK